MMLLYVELGGLLLALGITAWNLWRIWRMIRQQRKETEDVLGQTRRR